MVDGVAGAGKRTQSILSVRVRQLLDSVGAKMWASVSQPRIKRNVKSEWELDE